MKVSVIVVTLNEEKNILPCLQSLLKQDIPKEDYEILVVDGGSTDKTQENVEEIAKQHSSLKLLVKENGSITTCRNIGIKFAQHEYIAFTDADCVVPEDWLKRLFHGYSRHTVGNPKLAGVGGANISPENGNSFQQAIGIAFNSFLGSLGSIQAARMKKEKPVFSISCSNSLHRKKILEEVGMFSEDLGNQGEDWDLGVKLEKKGYVVYGLKDSFVWHNFRATPAAFWKNMVFYGDGRIRLTKKHPDFVKMKYILPLFFIPIFFLSLLVGALTKKLWIFVPFLYFPLIFLYSFMISLLQKKIGLVFHVFFVFVLQHFGYAVGMWKGCRWFFHRNL